MDELEGHFRSPIVGDLKLPPEGPHSAKTRAAHEDEKVPILIEINVTYPGGLRAARRALEILWREFEDRAGGHWEDPVPILLDPPLPQGLMFISLKLYQCVLSRPDLHDLVTRDQELARQNNRPPVIFRAWPDYPLDPQIDRSAPTVKADAAWRAYDARGRRIVWAVIDSGIDGGHPHFSALELASEFRGEELPYGLTSNLHRDFSFLVHPEAAPGPATSDDQGGSPGTAASKPALIDDSGHGTHVAGIISGCSPAGSTPRVALSKDPNDGGCVLRSRVGTLSGMAPECELVSLKVMRRTRQGTWVTSCSAVIRALTYLRTEINVDPAVLRVHGVNMSLGCEWHPEQYAAGQSPLCQAVNQLVATGVVVVVSAGNFGARTTSGDSVNTSAAMGSITEPAHAEDCVAVGSTHREAPHAFGVTWTSSKGPTLDGRMKPDVVAPGEWIASAASGAIRAAAGLDRPDGDASEPNETHQWDPLLTYAEQSGTSMAAPHVSGVIAAFLSVRPEFIGRPRQVKRLLTESATDLGRERYAQGAGLVDLMRMLSNV
ncbi:MAG: subtilase family serine proteinase [Pseudonocardia sp.]|nr:MAG: subtilase family serine proteinase [Pseudonocardia sp.]